MIGNDFEVDDINKLMKNYVKHALFEDTKILVSRSQVERYQKSVHFSKFISYLEKVSFNLDPSLLTTLASIYDKFGALDRFHKVVNLLVNRRKMMLMVREAMAVWNFNQINYLESFNINTVDGMHDYYSNYFQKLIYTTYNANTKKRLLNANFIDFSPSEWLAVDMASLFKEFKSFKLNIRAVVVELDLNSLALERKVEFILNNFKFGQSELFSIFESEFKRYRLGTIPQLLLNYPQNMKYILHLKCWPSDAKSLMLNHLEQTMSPSVSTRCMLKSYLSAYMLFHLLRSSPSLLISLFQPILMKRSDLIENIVSLLFSQDPLVVAMHQPIFHSDNTLLLNMIDLFGDKSQFLKEYQKSLSHTLLKSSNVMEDVNKMQKTLAHLGESCLQTCDQMMQDIIYSAKFTQQVQSSTHIPFDIKLLTQRFWPNVEFMSCEFDSLIKPLFTKAQQVYHASEPHKQLVWSLTSGTMTIEVDYDNITKDYTVLPIQALIMLAFDKQQEWEIDELASHLKVKSAIIKEYSQIWISQGIMNFKDESTTLVLGQCSNKSMLVQEQIVKMTPQLKIAMTMMRSIIRTRTKAQFSEIELAAKKSHVFKTFKHSVRDILQIMVQEKTVIYKDGFYRVK